MPNDSTTATRPPTYHWAIIVGSAVGSLGLAGSLVTIMISLTLGNDAVPVGLSGISSSLAVGGLLLAIVRLAARPKWAVDRMEVQDAKLDTIAAAVDAHAHHVEREHTGLHRDAVQLRDQLGLVVEALGRVLAYEEQRGHLRQEDHYNIGEMRQQLSDVSIDQGKRIELIEQALAELGKAASRLERRLAILTGGNVVDLDTVRAAVSVNGRLPHED